MATDLDIDEIGLADRILAHAGFAERMTALAALPLDALRPATKQLLERCHAVMRTDPYEASDLAQIALSVASDWEDPASMLAAASALAQSLIVLGQFADAVSTADAALHLASLTRLGDPERRELEIVRIGALEALEALDLADASTVDRFEVAHGPSSAIQVACATLRPLVALRPVLLARPGAKAPRTAPEALGAREDLGTMAHDRSQRTVDGPLDAGRRSRTPTRALPQGRAPQTAVQLSAPKRLRRLLDRILSSDADSVGGAGVGASLASAFAEIGPDLGVRALAWFTEEDFGFARRRAVGADVQFAERVDAETASRLAPNARRANVFVDANALEGPAASGLLAPGPSAILRFDSSPHQSLVLVALAPDADADAVEFVLGTIASAMSARGLRQRWRRSLEDAAEIQRGLLPTSLPSVPGLLVAARSVAADEVCGDLFDFFPFGKGVLGVAVGDASGHGLPAALVARDVVVGLRVGLDRGMRIAGVLTRLNRVLRAGLPARAFASLLYVEVRTDGALEYVSAGHPPALRVRRNGYTALRNGGAVLGPVEHVAYRRTAARLEFDETLVLYTDGITERRAPDGTMFGEERLASTIAALADRPLEEVIDGTLEQVRSFGGVAPWTDDVTLVVVRRARRSGERGR